MCIIKTPPYRYLAYSLKLTANYAQQSNGSIIETDENGLFNISVPVGVHEVKTVKANHIFENDGKITDKDGI